MFPLLFIAAVLTAPNPARHDKPTAVGLYVLARPTATNNTSAPVDPTLTPAASLTGTEFAVIREEPGRLMLRNKGIDVWVSRAEVMTPKEAIAHYTNLLASQPQANIYFRLAKAHELDFDWDAAIKDYDEAIKLNPQTYTYWNNRANFFSRKRDYAKALEGYDHAIKLSPTAYIPMGNRGNAYINLREWDKAIEAYDQAIKTNPTYARAYSGRSVAWREKRDYEKAMKDAQRGVELDSASPHTYNARGVMRSTLKEHDKAFADFEEALRFDPLFATGYYGRAGVYLVRKEYQAAIRDLDTAMRLTPKYAAAMARRAEAWVAIGNPRRALLDLDDAIAADDKYAYAYRQKAWLLATHPNASVRDGKMAVALARKALDLNKGAGGETWEVLAAALAETGDFPGAVDWQKKAVEDSWHIKEKGDGVNKRLDLYTAGNAYRE